MLSHPQTTPCRRERLETISRSGRTPGFGGNAFFTGYHRSCRFENGCDGSGILAVVILRDYRGFFSSGTRRPFFP